MAGAKSPHLFSIAFMCLLYCFFVLSMHVPSSSSLSFSFFSNTLITNPCEQDIVCCPDAEFVRTASAIELTRNLDTQPIFQRKGRVWYKHPVPLWNKVTGEVASFTTSFSFNITTTNSGDYQNRSSRTGDGMAFFLAPYPSSCISRATQVQAGTPTFSTTTTASTQQAMIGLLPSSLTHAPVAITGGKPPHTSTSASMSTRSSPWRPRTHQGR